MAPTNVVSFPEGGGHFWVYMQYVQGLRSLGCDVYWLERFTRSADAARDASNRATFLARMQRFGLRDNVVLYSEDGGRISGEQGRLARLAARADLLLNFDYGLQPELLARFRRTALVDIDPGLLQHWMNSGQLNVAAHDVYFTTGETVGAPDAKVPDCGLKWAFIRPAVALDLWPQVETVRNAPFTTVSSWIGGVDGEWVTDPDGAFYDNNKRVSFLEYIELPRRTDAALELALCLDESPQSEASARKNAYGSYAGDAVDHQLLLQHGWRVRHAREVAASPESYRAYLQGSRGEFSCAKPSCMRFRNAWISDRTLCYLASGRPAVVQNTGPSSYLPNGTGLFRFSSMEEAVAALDAIARNEMAHAQAARDIATEYFDARRVARTILETAL